MQQQHGPGTSSLFMGPGPKSWAVVVVAPDVFLRARDAFYDFRLPLLCSCARGPGVGDNAHTWTDTL